MIYGKCSNKYYFYYYTTQSELTTVLEDDNAIILYVSDNINSILRSDTEDDFMDSFKDSTNEKKRLIGAVDTVNLITNYFNELGDLIYTDSTSNLSGPIITFDSGLAIDSLVTDIDFTQSGYGDPSLDNVRSISGFTGTHIKQSGENLFDVYEFCYSGGGNRCTLVKPDILLTLSIDGSP